MTVWPLGISRDFGTEFGFHVDALDLAMYMIAIKPPRKPTEMPVGAPVMVISGM